MVTLYLTSVRKWNSRRHCDDNIAITVDDENEDILIDNYNEGVEVTIHREENNKWDINILCEHVSINHKPHWW